MSHDHALHQLALCGSFNVKADIVAGLGGLHADMMGLNRLHFACNHAWVEAHVIVYLQYSRFDTSNWDNADSRDVHDLLNWHAQRFVCGLRRRFKGVEGFNECWA